MITHIIPIGNSKGIRIPKALLQQCHFTTEVDMEVRGDTLVLNAISRKPRSGWSDAFKAMHAAGEDRLMISDALDLNPKDWQW